MNQLKGLLTYIVAIIFQSGEITNVFSALSYRPEELRAFLDYHEITMTKRGNVIIISATFRKFERKKKKKKSLNWSSLAPDQTLNQS